MKAFSVLAIMGLIIWATLFKSIVVAAFTLIKKEVVSEQCIQRNAAENFCQGSCYLKEKLALNEDLNRSQKPLLTIDFQDLVFLGNNLNAPKKALLLFQLNLSPYSFSIKSTCNFYHWRPPWLV